MARRRGLGRGLDALLETQSEGLQQLAISQLQPNRHQPRRLFDEAGLEDLREALEERLNALTAEADLHFGQPVVEPAARGSAHPRTRHARA